MWFYFDFDLPIYITGSLQIKEKVIPRILQLKALRRSWAHMNANPGLIGHAPSKELYQLP